MKARTNISQKPRRQLVLTNFKGVDFSSSPYKVDPKRASSMRNMINEYGVNHKRRGWHEARLFSREGKPLRINGIFEYHNGDYSCVIVHAGVRMYVVSGGADKAVSVEGFTSGGDSVVSDLESMSDVTGELTLTDTRSQAFYQRGRLYIIGCGDYLVYGSWDDGESYELRRVTECEDTYVPTTTISIDHRGAAEQSQATLDAPNRLTPYRKNQLVGASLTDEGEDGAVTAPSRTWKLDGPIDRGAPVTVEIILLQEGEERTLTLNTVCDDKADLLYNDAKESKGSVNRAAGEITLSIDTTGLEGDSNITVTFASSTEGYEDSIRKCQFGVLFGADGTTDRLFLSGNSDFPNADFYSEMLDYTYFPDINYNEVGSDASAILGYVRLADSTLVIFKSEYQNEPSIFYRTGSTDIQYDSEGVITAIVGLFPSVAGTLGESLISRHTLANFGGDCLMLSQNGVFGVVLGDNARTTERYTRERSRTINERLTKYAGLSDAVGVVYKNKYYLSIGGDCYVADGRFTFRSQDALDGAYNYEWWYWDNIPARVFSVINNQLYFGTEDGMLCRFDEEFNDRTYMICERGELSLTPGSREVTVSQDIVSNFASGDRITFTSEAYIMFYEGVKLEYDGYDEDGNPTGEPTGRLIITEDYTVEDTDEDGNKFTTTVHGVLDRIYNGTELYADNVPKGCGVEPRKRYVAVNVDRGAGVFMLAPADEIGDREVTAFPEKLCVKPTEGGFSLVKSVRDRELFVVMNERVQAGGVDGSIEIVKWVEVKEYEADELCATFASTVWRDGEDVGDSGLPPTGTVTFRRPIVAEWYTPILDMGTNAEAKTLLGITVCTEPETNGRISFGYETRTVSSSFAAKGLNVFSFDNMSFESFSFETGFASSYTKRLNERNFNFIIFRFRSESDTDCAVNDITLLYKINRKNIGVR